MTFAVTLNGWRRGRGSDVGKKAGHDVLAATSGGIIPLIAAAIRLIYHLRQPYSTAEAAKPGIFTVLYMLDLLVLFLVLKREKTSILESGSYALRMTLGRYGILSRKRHHDKSTMSYSA